MLAHGLAHALLRPRRFRFLQWGLFVFFLLLLKVEILKFRILVLGYKVNKTVLVADAVLQPFGGFQICYLLLVLEVIVFEEGVQLGRLEVSLAGCLVLRLLLRTEVIMIFDITFV